MPNSITENCKGCLLCQKTCPVNAIVGERKQVLQIDPHKCIECNACGRVCTFSAVLASSGEVIQHLHPGEWQRPAWVYRDCVSCNICTLACPVGAIAQSVQKESGKLKKLPYLKDPDECIGCTFCAASCPTGAVYMVQREPAA